MSLIKNLLIFITLASFSFTATDGTIRGEVITVSGEKKLVETGTTSKKITMDQEAIETLPIKESDRVELMAKSLAQVGCGVSASDSDLRITPMQEKAIHPVGIDPMNDHRIAMAMAVLGTKRGGISIVNPMCVSKSYPTFWKDLRKVFED